MKRIAKTAVAALALFLLCCTTCFAEDDGTYSQQFEASGAGELYDSLPEETQGYLERLGFENVDFYEIFSADPRAVIDLLADIVRGKLAAPMKTLAKLMGTVILAALAQSFFPADERSKETVNLVVGCLMIITVFASLFSAVKAAVSAVSVCGDFQKTLIPVLAGVVTAAGNPMLALSYQSFALAAANSVTSLSENLVLPLAAMSAAMGCAGSVVPSLNLTALNDFVRKTSITVLSVSATLFSLLLTVKCTLANSADTLAAKGIKLLIGSFLPVVGGAVSQAYSSILGSVSLIKSAVGVFSVSAALLTVTPVVVELFLWTFSLRLAEVGAQITGQQTAAQILRTAAGTTVVVNVVTLYSALVSVISSGLVIAVKTGV